MCKSNPNRLFVADSKVYMELQKENLVKATEDD